MSRKRSRQMEVGTTIATVERRKKLSADSSQEGREFKLFDRLPRRDRR